MKPGRFPDPSELLQWFEKANPFRREADMAHVVKGLVLAGLGKTGTAEDLKPAATPAKAYPLPGNVFKKEHELWQMSYAGVTVTLPEVKGYYDLAHLLAAQGKEVHCTEIMGSVNSSADDAPVLDQKARQAYEQRIRELRSEIDAAEEMNDLARREHLNAELDQLTEHLAAALGLGRRVRQLNAPAERARAAATWRIRAAIKKVEAAHPALGRHLANSIRTGNFCSYAPENEQASKSIAPVVAANLSHRRGIGNNPDFS